MSGLLKGMADAMQDGRSHNAESAAFSADLRANSAQQESKNAQRSADLAFASAIDSRKRFNELLSTHRADTAALSGCLMFMNAVIKTMDTQMSPAERERFRLNLAKLTRERIHEIDSLRRGTDRYLDIEGNFKQLDQNKILGIL